MVITAMASGRVGDCDGLTGVVPAANSAVHGNHIGVSHQLQIQRSQCRPKTAPAVQNQFGRVVWKLLFNIAFNHTFSEVRSSRNMPPGKFAFFPNVNQRQIVTGVPPVDDVLNRAFPNLSARTINNTEKTGRMCFAHESVHR